MYMGKKDRLKRLRKEKGSQKTASPTPKNVSQRAKIVFEIENKLRELKIYEDSPSLMDVLNEYLSKGTPFDGEIEFQSRAMGEPSKFCVKLYNDIKKMDQVVIPKVKNNMYAKGGLMSQTT